MSKPIGVKSKMLVERLCSFFTWWKYHLMHLASMLTSLASARFCQNYSEARKKTIEATEATKWVSEISLDCHMSSVSGLMSC